MKKALQIQQKIAKLQDSHQGVLSVQDLKNILQSPDSTTLYRSIRDLEQDNVLKKIVRGFYVMQQFSLEVLSQRLCEKSYISFGNVLAKSMLIGSIPQHAVYAAKLGKNRRYQSPFGEIIHLGILPKYFFGYTVQNGVAYADQEKAFLDTLYFYQKGFQFSFNVYQDIDTSRLDKKKIAQYLKQYQNPKFVKFVKGVLNGRD